MHCRCVSTLSLLIALMLASTIVSAQQIGVGVANQSLSDGYFERMGVQWGLRFPQGSFNLALPPFGGYAPGAGMTFGYGPFGFDFSQGSGQSFTSQSPSVLVPNGLTGYVADSSWSPFVIGNVPVVGGFPVVISIMPPTPQAAGPPPAGNPAVLQAIQQVRANPQPPAAIGGPGPGQQAAGNVGDHPAANALQNSEELPGPTAKLAAAQASSAGRAAPSVAAAREALEAERASQNAAARDCLQRGQEAEQAGKAGVAKIYYQMAVRHADGELKAQSLARLNALQAAASASR